MRVKRFRKNLIPVAGISVSAGAVIFLAAFTLGEDDQSAWGSSVSTQVLETSTQRVGQTLEDDDRPQPQLAPGPRQLRTDRRRQRRAKPARVHPSWQKDPVLSSLAREPDLSARIQTVGRILDEHHAEGQVALIARLLDAELPGTLREATALRLTMLSRLQSIPGARADRVLITRLDGERPRAERLLTLEILRGRPYAGRAEITTIASRDHDHRVQEKAQWVLARSK